VHVDLRALTDAARTMPDDPPEAAEPDNRAETGGSPSPTSVTPPSRTEVGVGGPEDGARRVLPAEGVDSLVQGLDGVAGSGVPSVARAA
jgi:hypothetical protein